VSCEPDLLELKMNCEQALIFHVSFGQM